MVGGRKLVFGTLCAPSERCSSGFDSVAALLSGVFLAETTA